MFLKHNIAANLMTLYVNQRPVFLYFITQLTNAVMTTMMLMMMGDDGKAKEHVCDCM